MRILFSVALIALSASGAAADTLWYCKGEDCVGRTMNDGPAYGTYRNPIQDEVGGDLSSPVHRGMYCVHGAWHQGWLRPWEHSPVVKPSCGGAVSQLPY